MSLIKVSTAVSIPTLNANTLLVIGIADNEGKLSLTSGDPSALGIDLKALENVGVNAKKDSFSLVPGSAGSTMAFVGLGNGELNDQILREVGGTIARKAQKFERVVFDLDTKSEAQMEALHLGFSLGSYSFDEYRAQKSTNRNKSLVFVSKLKLGRESVQKNEVISTAVKHSRDLVNRAPNELFPASFATEAAAVAKSAGLKIKVWDEKDLIKDGLGGISAVGAGSSRPPRLVKISYSPAGAKKHIALVGKGITFDSGGLSLKPAESMVGMKYDMTGAATVLNAVRTIAALKINTKVTAWMCLAENMPSGTAVRPNDVIRARNGKTIEVLNTDAEGRLVLADGLSMASEEFPDLIVDVATLTGAATIALGNRYAGLMGDQIAVELVEKAAASTGELVWHMPLADELRPLLDSDIADIANVKIGNRAGGMLVGGHFLQEFIGPQKTDKSKKIAWAHLDIAGPSDNSGAAYGYTPKGATGTMVRTLVRLAENLSSSSKR